MSNKIPNNNLVIATIAPKGYYNNIYSTDGFDVAHLAFDGYPTDFSPEKSDMCFSMKGFKHHILYRFLTTEHPEIFSKYKYVWIPDYDVDPISEDNIRFLFFEAERNNINICQPSLSQDSYRSFELVVNKPNSLFRATNYVEIMCPLFKVDILQSLLWTLKLTYSGWAQDALWARELDYRGLGIIDSVVVRHTKPMESQNWILPNGINADRELEIALELMGIKKNDWWPRELY